MEYKDPQPYLSSFACICVVLGSVIVRIHLTLRPVFRLHGVYVVPKPTCVSLTPFCSTLESNVQVSDCSTYRFPDCLF